MSEQPCPICGTPMHPAMRDRYGQPSVLAWWKSQQGEVSGGA